MDILSLFGFRHHTKYVKKHLHEANIRTSIYMCFVIIVIEIWMIFRSTRKYVAPAIQKGTNWFDAGFTYLSLFFLFMFAAAAMMLFSIYFLHRKQKKESIIVPLVSAGVLIFYTLFIFKEKKTFTRWDLGPYYRISYLGVIFFYVFAFLLGVTILLHTLYKIKFKENNYPLSIVGVIMFAAMCLAFGVKVGYTDFFSRFMSQTGLPVPTATGNYEIKSMLCFLTMAIYVGCLLIFRPYISTAMLITIFMTFYALLDNDPKNRLFS